MSGPLDAHTHRHTHTHTHTFMHKVTMATMANHVQVAGGVCTVETSKDREEREYENIKERNKFCKRL